MHEIILSGYNAYLAKNGNKRLYLGTAESYGIEKLRITTGSGWDDLSAITATFHPPNGDAVRVIVDENGIVEVPKEATAVPAPEHDPGMVVFSGVKEGMQRISTNILYIIGEHAGVNGAVTDDTPSEWEQLINIYESKFDKNQGKENAGKILGVDESGEIIPVAKVDWSQNDETAADYVKGRTHYSVPNENPVLFSETATFSETKLATLSDEAYQTVISADPELQYIVKIDDKVVYEGLMEIRGTGARVFAFTISTDNNSSVPITLMASTSRYTLELSTYLNLSLTFNVSLEIKGDYIYKTLNSGYLPTALGDNYSVSGWAFHRGGNNQATGTGSIAGGCNSIASGAHSIAFGYNANATATASHAIGYNVSANAGYSHAEGVSTTASGAASHAEGYNTIAAGTRQHVQGQYNIADTDSKYLHIVGNGKSESTRSNAHTLDRNGNAWYSGTLKLGGSSYDSAKEVAFKEDTIIDETELTTALEEVLI